MPALGTVLKNLVYKFINTRISDTRNKNKWSKNGDRMKATDVCGKIYLFPPC
jgi:hypothetical protein